MRSIVPRLFEKYLFFEAAKTWIIVAGALFFITSGMGFAKFITKAAAGDIPVNSVLLLAFYSAIENGELVFPISILLALLITLGGLYQSNEMTAYISGGAGLVTLYRPFLALGLVVAIITSVLTLGIAPFAQQKIEQLTAESTQSALQTLTPGSFHTFSGTDAVFYAEGYDRKNKQLTDVFIRFYQNEESQKVQTIVTAERAETKQDPASHSTMLVLYDGWRQEGNPGQLDFRLAKFEEHGVFINLNESNSTASNSVATTRTKDLWFDKSPASQAELQARISSPIAILILSLLCLPVGKVPPRTGRYGRIGLGILIYAIYINSLHLVISGIESQSIPIWFGSWPVHLLMLIIAIVLVMREQGFFIRRRYKKQLKKLNP